MGKDKQCTCSECNTSFMSFRRGSKFCSPKCNNLHLYKNRDVEAYNLRKRVSNKKTGSAAKIAKERYSSDLNYKLRSVLRARLNQALKHNLKSGSAVNDLGCSVEGLKTYLESKFKMGMTWDNWSRNGWHIDHIEPLSKFDLTNELELKIACHYTNLQPMWASENIKKGGA